MYNRQGNTENMRQEHTMPTMAHPQPHHSPVMENKDTDN